MYMSEQSHAIACLEGQLHVSYKILSVPILILIEFASELVNAGYQVCNYQ